MRKFASFSRALGEEGFSAADINRIQSPVGLDIGAETPREIAVSVMAQLIAWQRKATGL